MFGGATSERHSGVIGGRDKFAALLFGDNALGINNDDVMGPHGVGEKVGSPPVATAKRDNVNKISDL